MNVSRKIAIICLLVMGLSLGACGGVTRSDKPAVRTWWLEPYTGLKQVTDPGAVPLVALSVTVVPGLDTDRILTLSDTAELNHYSAASWAEYLPELVTSLAARTLKASGRFEVSSGRNANVSEDCNLQLEVREFFADIDSSGATSGVRVAIDGRFQCDQDIPMAMQLKTSVPVHDQRMSLIVAAFQQATDAVMKEMLGQMQHPK